MQHRLDEGVDVRGPGVDLLHGEDVDQAAELRDDLADVARLDDEHHAAGARALARADDEARDVVAAAPDEADRAVERAGAVVQAHDHGVAWGGCRGGGAHADAPTSTSISPIARPAGTIGKTF